VVADGGRCGLDAGGHRERGRRRSDGLLVLARAQGTAAAGEGEAAGGDASRMEEATRRRSSINDRSESDCELKSIRHQHQIASPGATARCDPWLFEPSHWLMTTCRDCNDSPCDARRFSLQFWKASLIQFADGSSSSSASVIDTYLPASKISFPEQIWRLGCLKLGIVCAY
jgi:hypothetical protein